MNDTGPRQWRLRTSELTAQHGAAFAKAMAALRADVAWPINRAVRIALSGDLGAGKTTWVQGFAAASGVMGAIASPTYSLVQAHPARSGWLVHADFYRLTGSAELDALALDDFDRSDNLWCIEWPERATERLGVVDVALVFSIAADAHVIRADTRSALGEKCLALVSGFL